MSIQILYLTLPQYIQANKATDRPSCRNETARRETRVSYVWRPCPPPVLACPVITYRGSTRDLMAFPFTSNSRITGRVSGTVRIVGHPVLIHLEHHTKEEKEREWVGGGGWSGGIAPTTPTHPPTATTSLA